MNEKLYKGIEITASTIASVGVDYVVTKAITNLVKPETVKDKILTSAGIIGINLAADYGICQLIHSMMYPSEVSRYEQLESDTVEILKTTAEFNQVMAEHSIRLDNKVDKVIKQIENMTKNGGNN